MGRHLHLIVALALLAVSAVAGRAETPATPVLERVWETTLEWGYPRTPAVTDTLLYIMERHGTLSILDRETGSEIGVVPLPVTGVFECSVWDGSTLYLTPGQSNMTAIDLAGRSVLWSTRVEPRDSDPCGVISSWEVTRPALGESLMYFGSSNGKVYCLDRASGRVEWEHDTGTAVAAPPCLDGDVVYVAGYGAELRALEAATGRLFWVRPLLEKVAYTQPRVLGDMVYVAGKGGTVFGINTASGHIRWRKRVGRRFRCDIAVSDSLVCAASIRGIVGLHPADGRLLWELDVPAASPVQVGDMIFCVARVGSLMVIGARDGEVLEKHDVGGSAFFSKPVVAGRQVFVAAKCLPGGLLVCFERSGDGPDPWSLATASPN
jgi:outer membrane protein assembly factor BamB